jgi:DNA-binding phage protein
MKLDEFQEDIEAVEFVIQTSLKAPEIQAISPVVIFSAILKEMGTVARKVGLSKQDLWEILQAFLQDYDYKN